MKRAGPCGPARAFGEDFKPFGSGLAGGHPAQPFGAAAQQFDHGQQADRDDHEDRRNGKDRGADLFAQAGKHLPRERFLTGRADKEHHDDFVKRGDEGEQTARDHARQDQRHLHAEEGCDRIGPHIRRRAGQRAVKAYQCRGDGDDDETRCFLIGPSLEPGYP